MAAERVQHDVHALAAGQTADLGGVAGGVVVDRVRAACGLSRSCLAAEAVPKTSRSSTVRHSCSTAVPDSAGRHVHQHLLAEPDVRDAEQHVA
jgi:hypothetical protein